MYIFLFSVYFEGSSSSSSGFGFPGPGVGTGFFGCSVASFASFFWIRFNSLMMTKYSVNNWSVYYSLTSSRPPRRSQDGSVSYHLLLSSLQLLQPRASVPDPTAVSATFAFSCCPFPSLTSFSLPKELLQTREFVRRNCLTLKVCCNMDSPQTLTYF